MGCGDGWQSSGEALSDDNVTTREEWGVPLPLKAEPMTDAERIAAWAALDPHRSVADLARASIKWM